MEKEKIPFAEKMGYGVFSGSINLLSQFINTFILFYFTDVFGLSAAVAGIVMSFGLIWDGVNDPLIASYADNHRFRNGERFRPYMIYISFPLAVLTVLMFSSFHLSYALKIVYCLVIYFLFYSLITILRLPMYNMPTLSTKDAVQRLNLNVFSSGGASIGSILAGVMLWPMVRAFAGLNPATSEMINPEKGFVLGAAVIGLLIISGSLFYFFHSKERVRLPDDESRVGIWQSLKILWKNHNFRYNTLFSTFYFTCNTLSTATVVYYTQYVLRKPNLTTLFLGCFAIGSIVALPFVKKLDIRFGRRKAMITGAGLVAFSKILFIPFSYTIPVVMVHALLLGISVAINIVMFSMTRSEVGDIVEHMHGRRIDSMITNLQGLINKCGTSLTTLLIGIALEVAGYNGELPEQSDAVIRVINSLMGWISLAVAVLLIFSASRITIEKEMAALHTEKQPGTI